MVGTKLTLLSIDLKNEGKVTKGPANRPGEFLGVYILHQLINDLLL